LQGLRLPKNTPPQDASSAGDFLFPMDLDQADLKAVILQLPLQAQNHFSPSMVSMELRFFGLADACAFLHASPTWLRHGPPVNLKSDARTAVGGQVN